MKASMYDVFVKLAIALFVMVLASCQSLSQPPLISYASTLPATEHKPPGLHARFFGTTTILIGDDITSIMVDGFFSRPTPSEVVWGLGAIRPSNNRIEHALERGNVRKIDVLVVAHSHHDHVMDAAMVATKTGDPLLAGSQSTKNILLASGVARTRIRVVDHGDQLEEGLFKITFFKSPHAPHKFKLIERMLDGVVDEHLRTPAKLWDYKVGGNYTFLIDHPKGKILIVPSANHPLGLGETKADVVFLSIGNLDNLSNEGVRAYWKEAVQNTEAGLVIPIHWDNFTRPLDQPLTPFPAFFDNTACSMETINFLAAEKVRIAFMPLFDNVVLPAVGAGVPRQHAKASGGLNPFSHGCRARRD